MASDPNNILSRMEVPSEPRIFILGSLESRITLFSQQVRALNLIFALEQKNLIVHGANNETCNDLAVIGGGVGGLTVAAAAVNRGFRVTIFERAGILVPLQRTNYTRWLHPNIYDWPRPGSENPDAGLPLLNWEANTTRSVISRILDEWKRFQDHVNIVRKVHDIKIEKMHSPNDAVRRITWNEKDGFRSQLFGIVVLAIGFGLERGVAGQPATAYWQNDDLNQRDPKGADLHILISGTGDGGLIDLCRAKIEDFVHHEIVHKILNNPELDSIKRELLEI